VVINLLKIINPKNLITLSSRFLKLIFAVSFQNKLDGFPSLKKAFESLTPGRQRAYNIYFNAPKQSNTRESRSEIYLQHILDGKGVNDL